jgi:hypothetical protein
LSESTDRRVADRDWFRAKPAQSTGTGLYGSRIKSDFGMER